MFPESHAIACTIPSDMAPVRRKRLIVARHVARSSRTVPADAHLYAVMDLCTERL
jgi:hypothetical protein